MAASAASIESVIKQRMMVWDDMQDASVPMLVGVISRHGLDRVECEISSAGSFYAGCEEIGSSDAAYMVDSVVRALGEPTIFNH